MWRLVPSTKSDDAERGAAGVVVALMVLVLIGAGAMAVDVGQIYSERAQLQNGADSAALAVARSCAKGPCNTSLSGSSSVAGPLADANSNDGHSEVTKIDVSVKGQVTVSTATKNGSSSFLTQLFSSALSAGPVTVGASSTASWGGPLIGPATLPLTFAPCQFDTGGTTHPMFIHGTETCVSDSPSGHVIAGGFEWIIPDDGKCQATVRPDDPDTTLEGDAFVPSKTGLSMPKECKDLIKTYLGTVVLFPVFDSWVGTGSGGKYYVKGYAALLLEGYSFPSMEGGNIAPLKKDRGIVGKFVKWVADPALYTGGGYVEGGVTTPPHLIK